MHFPRLVPYEETCLTQERWCLWALWEMNLAQGPSQLFIQGSSQIHQTQCPFITSVSSELLSLLEPRVSSSEWDFMCWPFKSTPGFLGDSYLSGG